MICLAFYCHLYSSKLVFDDFLFIFTHVFFFHPFF
jgi:hypothetical protein